jgi:hypothetical protein
MLASERQDLDLNPRTPGMSSAADVCALVDKRTVARSPRKTVPGLVGREEIKMVCSSCYTVESCNPEYMCYHLPWSIVQHISGCATWTTK